MPDVSTDRSRTSPAPAAIRRDEDGDEDVFAGENALEVTGVEEGEVLGDVVAVVLRRRTAQRTRFHTLRRRGKPFRLSRHSNLQILQAVCRQSSARWLSFSHAEALKAARARVGPEVAG